MEVVAVQDAVGGEVLHLLVGDLDAGGVSPGSSSAWTLSPVLVVVAAMVLTMTSWLVSGRPRQFIEMRENRRCSILFHLLVPGGKWQTVICSPVWAARAASSVFHRRVRYPLEPPPSAVISSLPAWVGPPCRLLPTRSGSC